MSDDVSNSTIHSSDLDNVLKWQEQLTKSRGLDSIRQVLQPDIKLDLQREEEKTFCSWILTKGKEYQESLYAIICANNGDPTILLQRPAQEQFDYAQTLPLVEDRLPWYTSAANLGHSNSQYELGRYYDLYKVSPTDDDIELSIKWLSLAAHQGHCKAQHSLAWIYNNEKTPKFYDPKRAEKLYLLSAQQGNNDSQNNLAIMYHCGRKSDKSIVLQDIPAAIKWYTEAANQRCADSQYELACIYLKGQEAPKNLKLAIQWLTFATNLDHKAAQSTLAKCYKNGTGVAKNADLASKLGEQDDTDVDDDNNDDDDDNNE